MLFPCNVQALEDLSIEKQTMKERLERELDSLRNNSSKSQKELAQQHQQELDAVRKQGQEELARHKLAAEEQLEATKQVKYITSISKPLKSRNCRNLSHSSPEEQMLHLTYCF